MLYTAQRALAVVKAIESDTRTSTLPPPAGGASHSDRILPRTMFVETRGYISRVVEQINGCYENGHYDACAVMMRRLLETLIIECFEHHSIANEITNKQTGDFYYLSDLISKTLASTAWQLGRNTKKALPKIKDIGDKSAHSRRYIAYRDDIDKHIDNYRVACQELLYLAALK